MRTLPFYLILRLATRFSALINVELAVCGPEKNYLWYAVRLRSKMFHAQRCS